MTTRKFLTSVADVFGYDNNGTIVFTGKTLLDSSIEVSLGSAPVRGGRGNQLQYIYYHTGEMKFTLTDTQWNLQMLGATIGSGVTTGDDYYYEESLMSDGSGNVIVTYDPLTFGSDAAPHAWYTLEGSSPSLLTYGSGKTFTGAPHSETICVRYYKNQSSASSVTISANMIPTVVKLVMETQLNSADSSSTNQIGMVQIIAPTVTLSGAFNIAMKADGVANTPLTATALAYNDNAAGCTSQPYYARIIEIIDSANWYDNVIGLSIEGGDFSLASTTATSLLKVWAVPSHGVPFRPPVADLDFTSSSGSTASVGLNTGLVTGLIAGSATITVKGSSALPSGAAAIKAIEARCLVTVPAA